jgi:hypothetical protein
MRRQMRMAAYFVAITLLLSGLALARDDDDDDYYRGGHGNSAQAHQYGYDNGYRDGLRHGREEARENDPTDFRTRDYDRATNGYQGWMGPKDRFRDGYRDGYQRGYQEAFYQSNRGGWWGNDHDRDDHVYERTDWPGRGGSWGRSPAYNYGYQDGVTVARSDQQRGKQFNSSPRGDNHSDRGYSSRYGDKNEYKAEYRDAYRQGYEAGWGRGYRRY